MNTTRLEHLETEIRALPLTDRLWLMERMARQMRDQATGVRTGREAAMAAMAADLQIQQELQEIQAE